MKVTLEFDRPLDHARLYVTIEGEAVEVTELLLTVRDHMKDKTSWKEK